MTQAIVFIDGGNWYFKLKELLVFLKNTPRTDFVVRGFCEQLTGDDKLEDIHYYIGKLKRKHIEMKRVRRCMQNNKS